MAKENLVIVHSFPTNSILLGGLKEFLEDFFNVYFVDLPGFNTDVPPLADISFDNYSRYVEEYVEQLEIEDYFLSGVSFGFFIVNNCKLDSRCKGFFAIEPFINIDYLKQGIISKNLIKAALFLITNLHLHNYLYHSALFKKFLLIKNPRDRIETMLETVDGFTFFETAQMILKNHIKPEFHDKPYILCINNDDNTINPEKIIKLFEGLEDKLIIKTKSEHYPENPTKEYFQRSIDFDDIKKVISFCDSI